MTVAENVAYGLEVRAVSPKERRNAVAEALSIVQMEKYAQTCSQSASGGQQQRVGAGAGLVIKPDVLLPRRALSNLDARPGLKCEKKSGGSRPKITTVYVTHDQKGIVVAGDRHGCHARWRDRAARGLAPSTARP